MSNTSTDPAARRLAVKQLLAERPLFRRLGRWLTRRRPKIFMLHRFASGAGAGDAAMPCDRFEQLLRLVSNSGARVLSLGDYIEQTFLVGAAPENCVVLTVDDGYEDFYRYAYPLLRAYQMPATFFVAGDFVLEKQWLWTDRIRFVLEHCPSSELTVSRGGVTLQLPLEGRGERAAAFDRLMAVLQSLPEASRRQLQEEIESSSGVALPPLPPAAYAAVSVSQLQEMAAGGIEIGAHSLTHPILSRLEPDALREEIHQVKDRLEGALGSPVRCFCYPNGQPADVNARVVAEVARAGYLGAVVYRGGDVHDRYRLPRMGLHADDVDTLWKLHGWEQLLMRRHGWLGRAA